MAFDIVYIFKAVNEFTKVAAKIEKSVEKIENRIKNVNKNFDVFKKTGKKSFATVGDSVKRTEKSFEKFNRQQKKAGRLMGFLGNVAGNLKFRLASLAVTTLAGGLGFKAGLTTALDFQDALINLEVITGATGKDLKELEESAFKMGKAFGISGAKVLDGMTLVGSAKAKLLGNIPALKELTRQVIRLSIAGGIDLPIATKALVGALNIFGKGPEDAERFVNILTAGAKFGASEISDTIEAVIRGGGAARAAGLDFLKTNVVIQALGQSFIKSARSGTAMNSMIAKLEKSGLNFRKIELDKSFVELRKELEKISDPQQRVNREVQLFGLFHKKAGFALLQNAERMKEWKRLLQDTSVTQEQIDVRMKRFRITVGKFGVVIEEKLFAVFKKIEPLLTKLVVDFTGFIESIDERRIQDMANAISILVAALTDLASILNALVAPFIFLSDIFSFAPLGGGGGLEERIKKVQEAIRTGDTVKVKSLLEVGIGEKPISVGATGTNGKVDVNVKVGVNENGRFEVITESTSSGDVELNTGQNLAFIG